MNMLSAFTARPIVELKQRDKSKIESILAYGDRVLVGLNTGSLRIYRVNETGEEEEGDDNKTDQNGNGTQQQQQQLVPPQPKPADLLREEEKFSRRPIQQLAIIKESNILVSLSDNHVSIHDLQSYALVEKLEKTRGATTFAVTSNIVKDPSTGIPAIVSRLAVAVKRKIILWTWQDMELAGDAVEITLIASVKSLTWATGTKVVAGMDPGFVIVDVENQEVRDIVKPGALGEAGGQGGARFGAVSSSGMGYMGMASWVPKPLATRLGEGELLIAKDVNSLFIDTDGVALPKRQVPWPSAPEALAYSYPYMLALQAPSKGGLEVRNPDTMNLLQTIALPGANFMHVPQPNISLAHAGKGFLVASDRCIWRMGAQNYESQIDELISHGRYDEGLSLLTMLEDTLLHDKEGKVREIMMLKAQALFDQRKYREAMDLFTEAKAPPERVIALYPRSIAGKLSKEESIKAPASEADADEHNTDGESSAKAEDSQETVPTPVTPASTFNRSMIGRLTGGRNKDSDTASIRSSLFKDDTTETDSIKGKSVEATAAQADKDKDKLDGKDLKIAVHSLQSFLAQCRVQIKRYIDIDGTLKEPLPQPSDSQTSGEGFKPPFHCFIQPKAGDEHIDWAARLLEVAQLVDTTLFRAYMLASPSLAGPLFRLPNFCDPDVVQEKLYETGRYVDLIDFLHGKGMHRQALELLARFGRHKNKEDHGEEEGETDANEDTSKQDGVAEVDPALQGPQRTVGYLQQLPPEMIDLILEFAEWPLRTSPDLGMEVFLADTENAETLPRGQVLAFLEKVDKRLAVRYLEHVIEELNDLTPDYHQRLIDLFLERLKGDREGKEADTFASEDGRKKWQERLQRFLKTSEQYNKVRVFRQLPTEEPEYFEARAIVLSKMGNHKQALQIYVFQLKDYEKAEEYCNQTFLTTHQQASTTSPSTLATTFGANRRPSSSPSHQAQDDAEPSIYHTLLSLYLQPPPPHQSNLAPALDLLSKHGARLPASTTLDLVPAELPVKELESYFKGRIRSANSILNEERICKGLWGVSKVGVETAVLLGDGKAKGPGGLNRRVVISEERHCPVCHKRFGGSAVRVYPDNSVVHSGCMRGSLGRKGTGRGWGVGMG